jgi:hypothetical protein
MEKGGETAVDSKEANNKIERKDADYTGYSEKQIDLNIDKGFTSGQAVQKGKKKMVTVFQKDDIKEV